MEQQRPKNKNSLSLPLIEPPRIGSAEKPGTPSNTSGESESQRRKKRSGWWDKSTDKEVDISKIKQMLRKNNTIKTKESISKPYSSTELEPDFSDTLTRFNQSVAALAAEPAPIIKRVISNPIETNKSTLKKTRKVREPWKDISFDDKIPAPQSNEANQSLTSRKTEELPKNLNPLPFVSHQQDNSAGKQVVKSNDFNNNSNLLKFLVSGIENILECDINTPKIEPEAVYEYLCAMKLWKTAESLHLEASVPNQIANYTKLWHHVKNHDFGSAIVLVQQVLSKAGSEGIALLASLVERDQKEIADRTLNMVIYPLVQKEQKRGGIRSEWFTTDFKLLQNLVSQSVHHQNCYRDFEWDKELAKFWDSANQAAVVSRQHSGPPPLFAYAMAKYFPPSGPVVSLVQNVYNREKLEQIKTLLKQFRLHSPPPGPRISTYSRRKIKAETPKNNGIEFNPIPSPPSIPVSASITSSSRSRNNYKYRSEGLPVVTVQENANFALSWCCGPANVRVMDIIHIPETDQIIALTAGTEKDISVWDVKTNSIINTLNNASNKPIVSLIFHPSYNELFLSADMEFDVKLWNWKEGSLVRWWKKHHSRIIYQLGCVPGDDTRAVSCSGDQSLKIWNIHSDKSNHRGSIHANEPITSFVFCGSPTDPSQQKIVVSLSYTLRIYKLRTLSLLHSISLTDLKSSKSPIFNMQVHPAHDNYILLSSDHQLRLFDLITETIIKTYSTRSTSSNFRLCGFFSPSGNFIYSPTQEVKNYSSFLTLNNPQQGDTHLNGILVWRLHTGKLEQREMDAMQENGDWQHLGNAVAPTPVLYSKWAIAVNKSNPGSEKGYKFLIQAGLDKTIRVFL